MRNMLFILVLCVFTQAGCKTNGPVTPTAQPAVTVFVPPTRAVTEAATATLQSVTTPTALPNYQTYRGVDSYNKEQAFELKFNKQVWVFVEKDEVGREGVLQSRTMKNCWMWLNAGPLGTEPLHTISLASGEWKVSRIQPAILMYSQDFKNLAFLFGVSLPKPYVQNELSPCLQMSEDVLKTFRVVEKT